MNALTAKKAAFRTTESTDTALPYTESETVFHIIKHNGKSLVTSSEWDEAECLAEAIKVLPELVTAPVGELVASHGWSHNTGYVNGPDKWVDGEWLVAGESYSCALDAWCSLVDITDPDGEYIEIKATSHDAAKSIATAQEAA